MNDSELLRRFADEHSEPAFAELVNRRVGLVYSAALRQLNGDAHRAEDVTQTVFIDLARKARSLCRHPALIAWLYTSTHHAAAKVLRTEQRRTRREQEAHAMHNIIAPASATDWQRVRPVLDEAMLELSERDRQTVLLRFFSGQSFASIAAELSVTENAVQKSTGRALDQLHAALARRGVTSTTAALAAVLSSQASAVVPTSLAATVTTAALGSVTGTAGILTILSTTKVVSGLGAGVTAVALGVAVMEYRAKNDAEVALASAERQRHAIQAELATMNARLAQAERRATDAEKDSGDLLKAVESLRAGRAAQATRPAAVTEATATPGSSGIVGMVQDARSGTPEERERVLQERSYQLAFARRRAEEAKSWVKIDQDAATMQDAADRYNWLIEAAEHLAATGEFQAGVKIYNRAMQAKPADLPVSDRVKELQATLASQNTPVDVTLSSDGLTWVSIVAVYSPQKLTSATVKTLPGNYEVIGRRTGYQDVVIPMQLRNGIPAPLISVACTVPTTP